MGKNKMNNDRPDRDFMPYIGFGATSIVFIAVSFCFYFNNSNEWEIWGQVFLNLGASVLVVLFVELIWKTIGGDPITKSIISLRQTIKRLGELESSGIVSIKLQRRQFEQPEYVVLWCDLIKAATKVDLMAFSLARQITREKNIVNALENAITSNRCRVRLLTFHPFTAASEIDPIALQRIKEEELLSGGQGTKAKVEGFLQQTWGEIKKIQDKFINDPERKDCLQIHATTRINLYTNIIRIDDRMWVSPYLASTTGGSNPAFEIAGVQTPLFQLYEKEFEHMWDPPPPLRQ